MKIVVRTGQPYLAWQPVVKLAPKCRCEKRSIVLLLRKFEAAWVYAVQRPPRSRI